MREIEVECVFDMIISIGNIGQFLRLGILGFISVYVLDCYIKGMVGCYNHFYLAISSLLHKTRQLNKSKEIKPNIRR